MACDGDEQRWAEERAAQLQADEEAWDEELWQAPARLPQPPPRMEPPPPAPPEPIIISGESVKVTFFGVGDKSAYLKPTGVGLKRGPLGKAEHIFSDFITLNIQSAGDMTTLGCLSDYSLKSRLDMSAVDIVGEHVKVLKLEPGMQESVAPFELLDMDTPMRISHVAGAPPSHKLVIYLRANVLRANRAAADQAKWQDFQEQAEAELGKKLSDNVLAKLVGHAPTTVKKALHRSTSPMDGDVRTRATLKRMPDAPCCPPAYRPPPGPALYAAQTLSAIERTMREHFSSNFSGLRVALEMVELKAGKGVGASSPLRGGAHTSPLAGGGEEAPATKPKRKRVNLSKVGQIHIDAYLTTYISLSGNATGRATLFNSILEAASSQQEVLGSEEWTVKIIEARLHNSLKEHNKKAKAAAAEATEAAEAEAAEAE